MSLDRLTDPLFHIAEEIGPSHNFCGSKEVSLMPVECNLFSTSIALSIAGSVVFPAVKVEITNVPPFLKH